MKKKCERNADATLSINGLSPGMLQRVLPFHAYQMYKGLSKYADQDLSEIELERSAFRPLLLIHANPGVAQGKLASALNLKRSSIVPAIDRLEMEGLVERRPHPVDGRSKGLWLTRKGSHLAAKIEHLLHVRDEKIFEGFSPQERSKLLELMQRATINIMKLAEANESDHESDS